MSTEQPEPTLVERVRETFSQSEGKLLLEQVTIHLNFIESELPKDSTREQAYAKLREAYREVVEQKGGESAPILYALID